MKIFYLTLMVLMTTSFYAKANAESFSLDTVESHIEQGTSSGMTLSNINYGMDGMSNYPIDEPSLASFFNVVSVPEPATLFLLGSGLIGFASTVRRKIKSN